MVGAEPVIWIANEGEAVTETEDTTESTSTEVFVQFTVVFSSVGAMIGEVIHKPRVTPLTLPFITTVVFLQPYKLTMWLISPSSTVRPGSFSWYSYSAIVWFDLGYWGEWYIR